MSAVTEYSHQKPDILHYAWLCQQRGIRVMAPPESEVLAPPQIYGYAHNSPMGRKLRMRELEVRAQVRDFDRQIDELASKRRHFMGVLDDLDWTQQTWLGGIYREQNEIVSFTPRVIQGERK